MPETWGQQQPYPHQPGPRQAEPRQAVPQHPGPHQVGPQHPAPHQPVPHQPVPHQPPAYRPHGPEPEPQGQGQGGLRDFFTGVRYLGRGLGWTARNPGLWLFGLIPALIALVVYVAALTALGFYVDDLAAWLTPFADGWSGSARSGVRLVAGLAIFGAGIFLSLITFTALTLLIGDPFYERIAVAVEESEGGAPPEVEAPLLTQIARAIKDTLILGAAALVFAVIFFVLGFVPGLGQTVVPVVAACVSGYFLAGELTSVALERRGVYRKERLALLRRNRPLAVGFGAATVALFLVPLGAVLVMPGAVAGGTLLARERLAPGRARVPVDDDFTDRPVTGTDLPYGGPAPGGHPH